MHSGIGFIQLRAKKRHKAHLRQGEGEGEEERKMIEEGE
jgi:hypothetical protein